MNTVPSDPLPDDIPSTSYPQPPPPPKPSSSPPLADTVVRPFTSQGSTTRSPLQLLTYAYSQRRCDDRPSSADGSPMDSASARFGPYMSASARTSYTRVDVDSLPSPVYPPLPPLPTAFMSHDVPMFAATIQGATLPDATTTPTATTPTPDPPTNAAQPLVTEHIPQTPQVSLTFLLVTGVRKTQSFEPDTTVGRVKELVWNAWPARDTGPLLFPFRLRDDRPCLTDALFLDSFSACGALLLPRLDWQDERPPAPSYLRILYLGKILQDDDTLLRAYLVFFPFISFFSSPTYPTFRCISAVDRGCFGFSNARKPTMTIPFMVCSVRLPCLSAVLQASVSQHLFLLHPTLSQRSSTSPSVPTHSPRKTLC